MFREEFISVIQNTGMVPIKDLRPLLKNKDEGVISEFELLKYSFFDDIKFARNIAKKYELQFVDLTNAVVKERVLNLIKKTDSIRYRVVPIQKTGKSVVLAIYDPTVIENKLNLQKIFQHPIEFVITGLKAWKRISDKIFLSLEEILNTITTIESEEDPDELKKIEEGDIGEEIITYVNKLMANAYVQKASDIHVEPFEQSLRIRFRVDGILKDYDRPEKRMILPIISRLKILADIDISERRRPQNGRIGLLIAGRPVDYRVSSLPTLFGEKIVLRLLDKSNLQLDMTKLGFEDDQFKIFQEAIKKPYGMVLVTGPTGSGKTTTLYSALSELNKVEKNISTAEDPCEFQLDGINQVNVRKDIGLTFALCLKTFLRQDPDIIMVGEIRDIEVGEIAIEAALTGHLVLSTLHTNDAPSTVTRFLNMGIQPFLLTGSLNIIVAQRLCRKICSSCKVEDRDITSEHFISCGLKAETARKVKAYKGQGCQSCGQSGYKGRIAIYEVMRITPEIRELILSNASTAQIKNQAIKQGMKTLRMSAVTKVVLGETTLQEAVTNSAKD